MWRETIKALGITPAGGGSGYEIVVLDGYEPVSARMEKMAYCARAGDVESFRRLSAQSRKSRRLAARQVARYEAILWSCRICSSGYLQAIRLSGRAWQVKRIPEQKFELPPEFVRLVRKG